MSETDSAPENMPRSRVPSPGRLFRRLSLWLFGHTTAALLRLLGATWRLETLGRDPQTPAESDGPAQLAALYHESMLPCAWAYRDRGHSVAVSLSRDGERVRSTLLALGYAEPARGSSSRGGPGALRHLLRFLAGGTTVALLVDGPRGPARRAKNGIVSIARLSGTPIQPVAFAARPALRLGSWDRSLIPLPFARVVCAYGEPVGVTSEAAEERVEQGLTLALDQKLSALYERAEASLSEPLKTKRDRGSGGRD